MNGPAEIKVVVDDGASGAPVKDAIVELTVRAGRKNPCHICFPKTDGAGSARITRDDFIGRFEDHWEAGLMDYDGSVVSASPVVLVTLFDDVRMRADERLVLAWPLLKHEAKKWKSRREAFDYFASCSNAQLRAASRSVDLHASSTIHFPVATKG